MLSPQQRRVEFERWVTPRVHIAAQIQSINMEHIASIIQELVSLDLALLPLLTDNAALEDEIADIATRLHSPTPGQPSTTEWSSRLRGEILRIDPIEVDQIMAILNRSLNIGDTTRALASKSILASRYNVAKRELIGKQEKHKEEEEEKGKQKDKEKGTSSASTSLATFNSITPIECQRNPDGQAADDIFGPKEINLDGLTLGSFVKLSIKEMISHIGLGHGHVILDTLGVQLNSDKSSVGDWIKKVMAKGGAARRTEIAAMYITKLDVRPASLLRLPGLTDVQATTWKRSQSLKAAKEMVNGESDDQALCEL
jgi:hypothetical protein